MKAVDTAEYREYYSLTNTLRHWLLFCGLWPDSGANIAYQILPHFVYTCHIFFSIVILRFAFAHITNISLVVRGVSLGTSFVSIALKVSRFTFYRESIGEIYTTLKNYHDESIHDEKLQYLALKKMMGFRRTLWIFCILVASSCVMYSITPLIFIMAQLIHHADTVKYILPTPSVYPWHIHPGGLLYKITYIFEVSNFVCLLLATSGVDSFFGYCILHVIGQLRILGYQMINSHRSGNYDELIRDCVKKYLTLKKCCDMLAKIYGPLILWMVITNSIIICTVFFQISQRAAMSIGKYILILAYTASKLMQTYLYAQAGNALTTESEAFLDSLYFSNWHGAGLRRFRTAILIMLTQKPLKIMAVNCVIVSNDMFLATLNTTVSYFFLLKAVEEK